jgi:CRISPR system Cascade subunit CasE
MSLKAGAELLVLSDREPEPRSERAVVRAKKIFDPVLREGLRLGFILTANVTKTIRDRDQPERKIRVPLIHEDEQVAWLRRKLEGVHLQSVRVQPHRPIYFRKGARPGKIVSTTFQGVIEVQQPEKLAELLRKGIGPAKAFGCGLMLVRPD